jgi:hypothetical protein
VAPEEVARLAVAKRCDRGGIREPDHAFGVDDPDRLCGRFKYGCEEILGGDAQASKVGQRMGHGDGSD